MLTDDIRPAVFSYVAGVLANADSPAVIVGGIEDHLHALIRLGRQSTIATVIGRAKEASTKWIHHEFRLPSFAWQAGYGAFSVSHPHVGRVGRYIETQEEHHRAVPFRDELLRLLEVNGVEYDERYLWD